MKQLVIGVIALGLAVGWFAPGGNRGGDEPREAASSAALTAAAGSAAGRTAPRAATGDAVLSRAPDGHFYAEVSIDSYDMRMLVDTGASVVALTGEDASALGLDWDESELLPVGRGANGDVIGKPVRLERVRLGDLEADNVEAVIVPEGLDISLLGQSFLGRVGKVEIEGGQMVLGSGG